MFRAIVVFTAISFSSVYSQHCDQFVNFKNNNTILSQLNGTFYEVLTSSDNVIPCEKFTCSGMGSELVCVIQSPGCCRKLHNFITTNPDHVELTVTPLTFGPKCLVATESLKNKFFATTGADENLCIILSACRAARQGVYVMCRQQEISQTLLVKILSRLRILVTNVLTFLLGVSPPLTYKTVSQQNCVFPKNICTV